MPNRFNHNKDIKNTQPAKLKAISPGMIITFRYVGENISDKNPLVLFLYRDGKYNLIDGLNLNYYLRVLKIERQFKIYLKKLQT